MRVHKVEVQVGGVNLRAPRLVDTPFIEACVMSVVNVIIRNNLDIIVELDMICDNCFHSRDIRWPYYWCTKQ